MNAIHRGGCCPTTACCKPVSESEKCFALPIKYVTTTHAFVAQPICVSQKISDIKPVNVQFVSGAQTPELRDFFCDIKSCGIKPACGSPCGQNGGYYGDGYQGGYNGWGGGC